jgi:hypothetical protein
MKDGKDFASCMAQMLLILFCVQAPLGSMLLHVYLPFLEARQGEYVQVESSQAFQELTPQNIHQASSGSGSSVSTGSLEHTTRV